MMSRDTLWKVLQIHSVQGKPSKACVRVDKGGRVVSGEGESKAGVCDVIMVV